MHKSRPMNLRSMYNSVWRSLPGARSHPLLSRTRPATHRHGFGGGVGNRSTQRSYCTHMSDDYYGYDTSDSEPINILADDDAAARTPTWLHCGRCGHRNPVAPPPQRRHLYVAVDDWRDGFSIHKLDLDAHDSGDQDDNDADGAIGDDNKPILYRRLPPLAARIRFANMGAGASFAALGRSKIVACAHGEDGLTVVYDASTGGAQEMVRRSPDALLRGQWRAAVAAEGSLYAIVPRALLSAEHRSLGGMYCLEEKIEKPACGLPDYAFECVYKKHAWSTEPLPLPSALHSNFRSDFSSYAVHPGGKTIFVSVAANTYYGMEKEAARRGVEEKAGTYSYDTESKQWKRLDSWQLPFSGHGHYDEELDAWVGIRGSCLYSCDIIPPEEAQEQARGAVPPEPKTKECRLDFMSRLPASLDSVIVSMGGVRFCHVQCGPRDWFAWARSWGGDDKFELRVTTFRASYGKDGELTTTALRRAGTFVLSRYAGHQFSVNAFWM